MNLTGYRRKIHTLILATLLLMLSSESVSAEFAAGDALPTVKLTSAAGTKVGLTRRSGTLVFAQGFRAMMPRAVVVHLLQPDCLQCRAQLAELQTLHERYRPEGVIVLGIAHRGTMEDLQQLASDLNVGFPLLHGVGSEIATRFSAGDTLGIADGTGMIRFAQVGFGKGDEALWARGLDEILAGRPVSERTVKRERLEAGDVLPAIELPCLRTGKSLALYGKNGRLTFRDEQGQETHPKAAAGFFSRY